MCSPLNIVGFVSSISISRFILTVVAPAPAKKAHSSQYKGVSYVKKDKVWKSQIMIGREKWNIGSFKEEIEAAKAYDKIASQMSNKQLGFRKLIVCSVCAYCIYSFFCQLYKHIMVFLEWCLSANIVASLFILTFAKTNFFFFF
jgi:hypothetical protein